MTIVENLQREDLSPLEQAESFRVLSNQFSSDAAGDWGARGTVARVGGELYAAAEVASRSDADAGGEAH